MIYTSHTDNSNALTQGTTYEKEKIILRKYRLYAAGICAAVVLGVGGCASNASAGTTAATQAVSYTHLDVYKRQLQRVNRIVRGADKGNIGLFDQAADRHGIFLQLCIAQVPYFLSRIAV